VLTAADVQGTRSKIQTLLPAYRAVVIGGRIDLSPEWVQRLSEYVRNGGTVVVNAAQSQKLPQEFLGVRLLNDTGEAHNAQCLSPGDETQDLHGQIFRYERLELKGAKPLMTVGSGDPIVTVNKVGKGTVIFAAVPDLLGEDERITPFAAHMLAHVFNDAVPLTVTGDVEYLVNRTANSWIVTMLNNNGVFKTQQGMAQVDRSAAVTATIGVPGKQIRNAVEWINDAPLMPENGVVKVQIQPGGVAIVELRQ
jgi:hypothetical protein